MTNFFSRPLCAAALLLCAGLIHVQPAFSAAESPAPAQKVTLPAIAPFFESAQFSEPKLSPSASHVAVRIAVQNGRDRLAIVRLSDMDIRVVAEFADTDIAYFEWIDDERLIFNTNDRQTAMGDKRHRAGLYAVNRDGSQFMTLVENKRNLVRASTTIKRHALSYDTEPMYQQGAQDSKQIYVQQTMWSQATGDFERLALMRLDTVTGVANSVTSPGKVSQWVLDARGQPRLALTTEEDQTAVFYLDPASAQWRKLTHFATFGNSPGSFQPMGFDAEGKLYVASYANGDKRNVHLLDLNTGKILPDPVVAMADYDFQGELIYGRGKLLGLQVLSDARSTHWFDPAMKEAQQHIDSLLPATINLLTMAARADAPWLLVTSYSDAQPANYLLYNLASKTLSRLGGAHPRIDPAQMGRLDLMRYKARDGLSIPAWLTLPKNQTKQLPMVVLVHGGPYMRGGEWEWNGQAQFLASRGYAVLEPEYRGSIGFGNKHFESGWKQWGLAMQNDIADGARWAIAQGIADPKRICIAGASYGGYAALMGLVNDPDLFRCGIAWAAVTDLATQFSNDYNVLSDMSEYYKQYGMPLLIGDPVKDAERFRATSPLRQAARIKRPLLLAHGSNDLRVPYDQGKSLYQALKGSNPDLEWIMYDGEGHGWGLEKNRIDFWTRVEQFLARYNAPQ
ncbi:S9 family peptidase [Oxalobacteraceae bacterium]|nr:S9 family peptidase [Oxalobacteraceae bacterium]